MIKPVYVKGVKIGFLVDVPERSEEISFHFSSEDVFVPEEHLVAAFEAIQERKNVRGNCR